MDRYKHFENVFDIPMSPFERPETEKKRNEFFRQVVQSFPSDIIFLLI